MSMFYLGEWFILTVSDSEQRTVHNLRYKNKNIQMFHQQNQTYGIILCTYRTTHMY